MHLELGNQKVWKSHGDLLPLPLDWSAEDEAWDMLAKDPAEVQKLQTKLALKGSEKAWTQAVVMAINTLYEAP